MSNYDTDEESNHTDDDIEVPNDANDPNNAKPLVSPIAHKYKVMTTEGSNTDLGFDPKLGIMQCEFCGRFYSPDVLVMVDPLQCKHCFFYMNYGNANMINGQNGITVHEYIEQCKNSHPTPCMRLADGSCNCYICANNMGFPLDGVMSENDKKKNLNQPNQPIPTDDDPSDCSVDDIGDDIIGREDKVVVYL